jgi:endonuclease IV
LKPQFIIFHPGIDGNVKETVHQIGIMKEKYPEVFSIAIIENKPAVGLKNEKCIGALFEEISLIINETSLGFCLDFGHAICAAYSFKKPWKNYIEKLIDLKPDIFHISDGHTNSPIDEHLNIGDGDYDFDFILSKLQSESLVSLETKKKSSSNLDDFRNDSLSLKRYIA